MATSPRWNRGESSDLMKNSDLFLGDKVRLSSLNRSDASVMARWHNGSKYQQLSNSLPAFPHGEDAIAERLEEQQKANNEYHFAIRLIDSDELIGTVSLNDIEWSNRVAWLSIGIGEIVNRGKGCGYESMQLALGYAFLELNLHRVQLTVFDYNESAIVLYEKLGFRREGIYREFGERLGHRYDMLLYGLLCNEWEQ